MSVKNKLNDIKNSVVDTAGKITDTIGTGVKGIVNLPSDIKYIKIKNNEIKQIIKEANEKIEPIREETNTKLEEFGKRKVEIIDTIINEFSSHLDNIKNLPISNFENSLASYDNFNFSKKEIDDMQTSVLSIKKILKDSTAAGVLGATSVSAAYSVVAAFGAASTGTLISTTTGVAAYNATLAWLGGGALAVGGGGMALGAIVLGGIAIVPAVSYLIYKGKFDYTEEREKVNQNYEEAILFAKNMDDILKNFNETIKLINNSIILVNKYATECNKLNKQTDHIVGQIGDNYLKYNNEQQELIQKNITYISGLFALINTPIMNDDGSVNKNMGNVLIESYSFINDQKEIIFIDYKKKTFAWLYTFPILICLIVGMYYIFK